MSHCIIISEGVTYNVTKVQLPAYSNQYVSLLENFSGIFHSSHVSSKYRVRKTRHDFYLHAVKILKRIVQMMGEKKSMVLGSRYLPTAPIYNFGLVPQYAIRDIYSVSDLKSYFLPTYDGGNTSFPIPYTEELRYEIHWLKKELQLTTPEVLMISLRLMATAVSCSGPDCDFVSDMFTTDTRNGPNFNLWVQYRKRHFSQIKVNNFRNDDIICGVVSGVSKNVVAFTEIPLENIWDGEKVSKYKELLPPKTAVAFTEIPLENIWDGEKVSKYKEPLPPKKERVTLYDGNGCHNFENLDGLIEYCNTGKDEFMRHHVRGTNYGCC